MPPTRTKTHPIQEAERDIKTRPKCAIEAALRAIGESRSKRSEQKTKAYLTILARAVLSASEVPIAEEDEDPVVAMLADRGCDRMACATLLRLIVADDEPFTTDSRLRGAMALFDRTFAASLYPEAGLTEKAQSFEKRDRLRTLVSDHEKALFDHVQSLGSLDAISSFRQGLGKLFGVASTRILVQPFLPDGITAQTFDELLGVVEDFRECTDASLVGRSEAIEKRCQELRETADELGTLYARKLISEFAVALEDLVTVRVGASGFADPASIAVALRAKRYPFEHARVPVTVRLDLTNDGPGQAQDLTVEVEGGGAISFDETTKVVGLLGPGVRQVDFQGIVVDGTSEPSADSDRDVLFIKVTWRDSDGSEKALEEIVTLQAQHGDVAWDRLELEQPYRLEPIKDIKDFVGRRAVVKDLVKVILQSGNARIEGEKRVGKTSLAYAVSAAVEEQLPGRYVFLQLESGDFNAHTPEETVARLGELVAEGVRKSDPRLGSLPTPDFTPGLSTLTEFFGRAQELAPDRSFVIVLDEFDALPHEALYKHEPVGHAFFQTLRSLAGKSNVGFILIGAERMQWVIATHGQTLNKFKVVRLDYFTEEQIGDYAELVRAPVSGSLQFSEEAIDALYRASAGNPWMTKLLLIELFERQVERRDRDVQEDDVEDAINCALPKFTASSFQHFWDDAIRGDVEDREHVSTTRRRVLLGLARRIQGPDDATEEAVMQEARNFNVDESTAREVIRGFLDRTILAREEGRLVCRVPLFERWLVRHGAQEIILGTGDDDALIRRQRAIEEMRPTQEEIEALVDEWRSYRGRDLRPHHVSAWLEQFGGPEEQRLAMPILTNLRFYTTAKVNEKLRDLHGFVRRELASKGYEYKMSGHQRNRDDLLVCGLDEGGSGASHLLKQYRDENGIYKDCVVNATTLRHALDQSNRTIRAVILLDDFMGTGKTATKRLQQVHELWTAEHPWPASVDVFLLTVTAFESAVRRVERVATKLAWPVVVRAADPLGDQDRCFHEESSIYPDGNEREQAQALCARFGVALSSRAPTGFGDTQAAVCFEYRCPNNTLPVLWGEGPDWKPLFERQ